MHISTSHRNRSNFDVAIIGGGPSGSLCASVLLKYAPELRVCIIEQASFPREHVGESLLPGTLSIINEVGAWDAIEREQFPIKLGATYTWGRHREPWDYFFFPVDQYKSLPRPRRFEGQTKRVSLQVDRARFDKLLLEHAVNLGAELIQPVSVEEVEQAGNHVDRLRLSSGESITAKHYVDASGSAGVLRRALDVGVWQPQELRNLAVWNYWDGVDWATEPAEDATLVQVRSIDFGWLWYIPLSRTRASVGLVTPVKHVRASGKRIEDLYQSAISQEPRIRELLEQGRPEGQLRKTRDWSHLAHQTSGPNWFLIGESAGFADPILTAGLNLASSSAKDAACTILELHRGSEEADWLRERYDERTRGNIEQHIKFAQYWYAANGCFEDLQDHCSTIAKEAGFSLSPQAAWAWLAQGGFAHETIGSTDIGSFPAGSIKELMNRFGGENLSPIAFHADGTTQFTLQLEGCEQGVIGYPSKGSISKIASIITKDKIQVPLIGATAIILKHISESGGSVSGGDLGDFILKHAAHMNDGAPAHDCIDDCYWAVDMLCDLGMLTASRNSNTTPLPMKPAFAF